MSRKKIVAGNWKMNLSLTAASELVIAVKNKSEGIVGVEKIIFPPAIYLQMAVGHLSERKDLYVGAQNCSEHDQGAYTGEISAAMIKSTGSAYVLIGHSERRQYFLEKSEQLVQKIQRALENNLKIIYCFGELLAERKNGQHFETVKRQLTEVLHHFPKNRVNDLVLAYEPVWAIGTGETASAEQAQEMHAFVRKELEKIFDSETAQHLSILYGGSCNAQNAKELFANPDVDGGLIGGASLKAEDFCTIMSSFA